MNDTTTAGHILFGRYAYPPNELGYCGPTGGGNRSDLARHAEEFEGAWPYLSAIANAVGTSDVLDETVVSSYWVGGGVLCQLDPGDLLARLRMAFRGQVTGLLDEVPATAEVMAHHSFHVFVVYPWVRFLRRATGTALEVLQDCRIRWGTVDSVAAEHAVITSRPLQYDDGRLTLGEARPERVRWKRGELSLAPPPIPGTVVSAHWDWVCATLTEAESAALEKTTQATLDLVNTCSESGSQRYESAHTGVRGENVHDC